MRGVRLVFPEQESDPVNSARMNKSNFTTKKIVWCTHDSVMKFLFIAMLTIGYNYRHDLSSRSVKTVLTNIFANNCKLHKLQLYQ